MFDILSAPDGSYQLSDQDSQVTIYPDRGGIVTQVAIAGQPQFYLDSERFQDPSLSVRGGIPILFPICGNLPDNEYSYEGKTYQLPQHGFGRTLPWQVIDQSTDGAASLTVQLVDTEATRAVYPFGFALSLTYRWHNKTLDIISNLTNTGDTPLPYSLGYHPYFVAAAKSQLSFDLPTQSYYDRARDLNSTEMWPWDVAEIDALLDPLSAPLDATVTGGTYPMQMQASAAYKQLVFWTVKDKPFYCLEPWTGPRNALNTGTHLITVAPGATDITTVSIGWHI